MTVRNDWEMAYEAAVLETNSLAMSKRIEGARNAIAERVSRNGVDFKERQAIIDALNALTVLKRERCGQSNFVGTDD